MLLNPTAAILMSWCCKTGVTVTTALVPPAEEHFTFTACPELQLIGAAKLTDHSLAWEMQSSPTWHDIIEHILSILSSRPDRHEADKAQKCAAQP